MSRLRAILLLLAIAAQLGTLAYMVADKEAIIRHGHTVYLRTLPLDPRDPMRGDYVRLAYSLNQLYPSRAPGLQGLVPARRGEVVYALLRPVGDGVYELDGIADRAPESGVFLRGRVQADAVAGEALRVNYGIEQLFVEQGQGIDIEQRQRGEAGFRRSMEVALAVDEQGRAIVTGYRWAPLAISVSPAPEIDGAAATPRLLVQLKNLADYPLAVVDNAEHCGVVLTVVNRLASSAAAPCGRYLVSREDIIELAPGAVHRFTIDLAHRRWFVDGGDGLQDVREVAPVSSLRLVYRSPAALQEASAEINLWRGELHSAPFSLRGFE